MAGMKWDMVPARSANCPGESEISQGLLRHSSWGVLFTRRRLGEDPQTPSYVPITGRLAVCVWGDRGSMCVRTALKLACQQ